MKRVLLALLGLILLAILAYFCFQNKADTIREHLVSSTNSALSQHDITGVNVSVRGQDMEMTDIIKLTGEVPSLEVKATAETLARGIAGVGAVDNQLSVSQEVAEPMPTQEIAQTPKAEEKVAKEEPYTLSITKDEEATILLEGSVDNEKQHDTLIAHAQKLFGSKNVTDKLKVVAHAPKDWEYIATFALDRLKDVDYGDMKLHNQSYEFTGHLPSPSSKAAFLDGIREVMSNPDNKYGRYRGDYIITAPVEEQATVTQKEPANTGAPHKAANSIAQCQTSLDHLLANHKILFDYNKASIKTDSYALLDTVLSSMQNCHLSLLEIDGHTDSKGSSTYNKRLSQLRAASVKNYFVQKGFDKNKLETVGYGESQPIASNASAEGRAMNRRIEFIVKGVEK